uniref:Uncharacterized protein n=1 Tax=Aegilops tauschii subsp. strangulata TaxID=200361 RepID=A0A453CBU0_AEGTS
ASVNPPASPAQNRNYPPPSRCRAYRHAGPEPRTPRTCPCESTRLPRGGSRNNEDLPHSPNAPGIKPHLLPSPRLH